MNNRIRIKKEIAQSEYHEANALIHTAGYGLVGFLGAAFGAPIAFPALVVSAIAGAVGLAASSHKSSLQKDLEIDDLTHKLNAKTTCDDIQASLPSSGLPLATEKQILIQISQACLKSHNQFHGHEPHGPLPHGFNKIHVKGWGPEVFWKYPNPMNHLFSIAALEQLLEDCNGRQIAIIRTCFGTENPACHHVKLAAESWNLDFQATRLTLEVSEVDFYATKYERFAIDLSTMEFLGSFRSEHLRDRVAVMRGAKYLNPSAWM